MYFDPDFQKPKTSKFTKKAMAFREDLFMGVSMVEKIMRRTNLLAYSREMDQFIDPYGIELFLYHLKEQITVTYTPYNLNIDYNPDRQQVFSSQMCASGIARKIQISSEGHHLHPLLTEESDEEPKPALIDRQAGFNLPHKDPSCILISEPAQAEIFPENDQKKMSLHKRATHLKQGKKKPTAVGIAIEETLNLNEHTMAMKARLLEEKKRIHEENERKEREKRLKKLLRRQMIERNKELAKKKYTYDYDGNLLFVKKLNGDKLPKNTINLPYKWHLTDQEMIEIEKKEKKNKEAARRMFAKDNAKTKPKAEKLYKLPPSFAATQIPPKFEYERNGNYDLMKPQMGVTMAQNGKRRKSQPFRGSIKSSSNDGRSSVPKDVSIDDLEELTGAQKMPDFDEIDPIFHTQPDRLLTKISSDNHVRVVDRKAVKWMITTQDKNTKFLGSSKTVNKCKSKKPKINTANLKVNPRVNTASRGSVRRKLSKNYSQKQLTKRSSRKSLTERIGDTDLFTKITNPHLRMDYQAAFGAAWGQEKGVGAGIFEKELAKRPKSRQIGQTVSARNLLHTQRISLKTQSSKKRGILPQPPFGQTLGHGIITKTEL
ncbi:unnamed protein product [Moneuplotes crassus]|uniref:Uncharacterized protein n=1 Tax=Euplotes crassus TaxID=5936 RepID=A0AAD1U8Y8_EUPCR|nr:unnamed protein product [Moneuplotes crassus]